MTNEDIIILNSLEAIKCVSGTRIVALMRRSHAKVVELLFARPARDLPQMVNLQKVVCARIAIKIIDLARLRY